MRHNFKNLKIWILAMEVASDIHKLCLDFPKTEQYGLISQMNRASVSIPSNIALGSSFELQTQLLIARQNNYISESKTNETESKIIELQKMISGFIKRLEE